MFPLFVCMLYIGLALDLGCGRGVRKPGTVSWWDLLPFMTPLSRSKVQQKKRRRR